LVETPVSKRDGPNSQSAVLSEVSSVVTTVAKAEQEGAQRCHYGEGTKDVSVLGAIIEESSSETPMARDAVSPFYRRPLLHFLYTFRWGELQGITNAECAPR
jgi:hypothetical protein